jgi:hypothetical protein
MITIEKTAVVDSSGRLTVSVPDTVAPGTHEVVVIIRDVAEQPAHAGGDPFGELAGAYVGEAEATGRNAEEILYGRANG